MTQVTLCGYSAEGSTELVREPNPYRKILRHGDKSRQNEGLLLILGLASSIVFSTTRTGTLFMTKATLTRAMLLLAATTLVQSAHAQAPVWYQVELIVFEYRNDMGTRTELWPDDPGTPNLDSAIELIPWTLRDSASVPTKNLPQATGLTGPEETTGGAEAAAPPEPETATAPLGVSDSLGLRPFVLLPDKDMKLKDAARKLATSGSHRVLIHAAWRQPLNKTGKGPLIHLHSSTGTTTNFQPSRPSDGVAISPPLPTEQEPLDGMVQVVLSRYLHLNVDLLLHKPYLAKITGTASTSSTNTATLPPSASADTQVDAPLPTFLSYRLTSSRRMRSNEIHYIDHPALGVIAHITPVKLSATGGSAN